jgi:hypothetical protein
MDPMQVAIFFMGGFALLLSFGVIAGICYACCRT